MLATTTITMVMMRTVSCVATSAGLIVISILQKIKRQDVAVKDAHPQIAAKSHVYLTTVAMETSFNALIAVDAVISMVVGIQIAIATVIVILAVVISAESNAVYSDFRLIYQK